MSDSQLINTWRKSPIAFIKDIWGLVPQPLKSEYIEVSKRVALREFKKEWFEPFIKGKHITWQQWVILLAVEKSLKYAAPKRLSVATGHGIGKALFAEDYVPTIKGMKLVKEIKVGDYLFGEKGEKVKVKAVKNWGKVPFYKVNFDDKSSIEVSSGHLWKVKNRQDRRTKSDWQILETEQIIKLGIKRPNGITKTKQWEIPIQGIVKYKNRNHLVDPYTYGVWLGDGDKRGGKITNFDKEVWDNIPYNKLGNIGNGVCTVERLVTKLKKDNLFGCTTYTARIDRRYIESDKRLEVLRGLLDTDGWVEKSGGVGFGSTSRQLTRDVIEISRSLGLKTREEKFKKNDFAGCWLTHITWNGKFDLFKIKRKQNKLILAEERYQKRWISSIEKIDDKEGICFEVENNLFLTKDYHVTHNSCVLSWLILWYLFCFKDAQIPCTAPTSEQIHDVLWKETAVWLNKMPTEIKALYGWSAGYIRIKESPETWFARARTARKENPEALAGIHGDFVLIAVDESSGVPNEIFKPAEGAMTNENILIILIGNPVRNIGYFYDTHHSDKLNWQGLSFSSEESPIVEYGYCERIATKFGLDSDEYRYMVLGLFPKEDTIDDKGYVPLLVSSDLKYTTDEKFVGSKRLGIDPAGEGSNKTAWVIRDNFKAMVAGKEEISNGKGIAQKSITLMDFYGMKKKKDGNKDVIVDAFGIGVDAVKELALAGYNVNSVNVGDKPKNLTAEDKEDEKLFINKRAMAYDRMKNWLRSGGELVNNKEWSQLLQIKYTRILSGKKKIMGKEDMRKLGIQSPDIADALMLTFIEREEVEDYEPYKQSPWKPLSEYEGTGEQKVI
uniref:Putative homing endonuclease n=1 Tax=viral metagenome TaxID=1070528 RepID=A0A6H1ZFJ3_9ZZZZ